jgi:RHS repeat-associated protein
VNTSTTGGDYTKQYTLDLVGNRTKLTETKEGQSPVETTYNYNARDELLTETTGSQTTAYGYDANGALTTLHKNGALQPRQVWDVRGRLAELRDGSDVLLAAYRYTPDGIRSEVTEGGSTVAYIIDGLSPSGYAQVIEERASGLLVASYVYVAGLNPLSVTKNLDAVTGLETALYLADGHSGVRQLIDLAGTVQAAMRYDAFGSSEMKVGPWANANVIGYRGERFDASLGHYYLRARFYNPRTGRFSAMDSFAGNQADPLQLMRYGYASLNPISNLDPSGLFTISGFLGAFQAHINNNGMSITQGANGVRTANSVKRLAHIYNKVLKLLNKWEDVISNIKDVLDLLDFDLSDLKEIIARMGGLDQIASNLPHTKKTVTFALPAKVDAKVRALTGKVLGAGIPAWRETAGSEFIAELASALIMNLMDFTQSPVRWSWSKKANGPDQLGKNINANVWGVFEAKGGKAQLKSTQWGLAMSGTWLEHWIQEIYNTNNGQYSADLKTTFTSKTAMLAAIVRVNYDPIPGKFVPAEVMITFQKYTPPRTIGDWGKKAGTHY